jgi:hypothetical protein
MQPSFFNMDPPQKVPLEPWGKDPVFLRSLDLGLYAARGSAPYVISKTRLRWISCRRAQVNEPESNEDRFTDR